MYEGDNKDLFYDNEALLNKASYDKGKEEIKIEIAKKMIELGETNDKIKLYTELPIEEIEKLRKN